MSRYLAKIARVAVPGTPRLAPRHGLLTRWQTFQSPTSLAQAEASEPAAARFHATAPAVVQRQEEKRVSRIEGTVQATPAPQPVRDSKRPTLSPTIETPLESEEAKTKPAMLPRPKPPKPSLNEQRDASERTAPVRPPEPRASTTAEPPPRSGPAVPDRAQSASAALAQPQPANAPTLPPDRAASRPSAPAVRREAEPGPPTTGRRSAVRSDPVRLAPAPVPVPRAAASTVIAARPARPALPSVEIGSIEVEVIMPPAVAPPQKRVVRPRPLSRPTATVRGPLSRGYSRSFGLPQS